MTSVVRGGYTEYMKKNTTGFTIVELLIVIVVIAILASISIVAYNGIRQRANNIKTISDARSVLNVAKAYRAAYGGMPFGVGVGYCATADNNCTETSSAVRTSNNAAFLAELQKIGTVPPSSNIPVANGAYGISYLRENRTINGVAQEIDRLEYFLQGEQQKCALSPILNSSITGLTTAGYTSTGSNRTVCWILVE